MLQNNGSTGVQHVIGDGDDVGGRAPPQRRRARHIRNRWRRSGDTARGESEAAASTLQRVAHQQHERSLQSRLRTFPGGILQG